MNVRTTEPEARVDRVYELTSLSVAGRATDAQLGELDRLVCEDPACRRAYVRFVQTDACLREWADSQAGAGDHAASAAPVRAIRRWGRLGIAAVLLIAAGVVGGMFAVFGPWANTPAPPSYAVGSVISAEGNVIQDGRLVMNGDTLTNVPFQIGGGIAEIVLDSGVRVMANGPTQLTFRSSMIAYLGSGRVTVRVPENAIGFRLDTPRSKVIDLGTEFGVDVAANGDESVFVFEGSIRYRGSNSREQVLVAGEGLVRSGAGKPIVVAASPERFDSFARVEALARAEAAAIRLGSDPSLVVYYDFESVEDDGRIANQANGSDGNPAIHSMNGAGESIAPLIQAGRLPGLNAITLNVTEQRALVVEKWAEAASLPAMTIIGWVFLEGAPEYQIIASNWNQAALPTPHHGFHFHIRGGRLELLLPDPSTPGEFLTFATSEVVSIPAGRWSHVAVTIEPGESIRFYLDGILLSNNDAPAVPQTIPLVQEPLIIGGQVPFRSFEGRIDELAILSRVMSAREISRATGTFGVAGWSGDDED